jgi:hypothetical protein
MLQTLRALIDASTAALPLPSSRSAALLPTLSTFPEIYKLEVDLRQFTFTNSKTCFVAKGFRSLFVLYYAKNLTPATKLVTTGMLDQFESYFPKGEKESLSKMAPRLGAPFST